MKITSTSRVDFETDEPAIASWMGVVYYLTRETTLDAMRMAANYAQHTRFEAATEGATEGTAEGTTTCSDEASSGAATGSGAASTADDDSSVGPLLSSSSENSSAP